MNRMDRSGTTNAETTDLTVCVCECQRTVAVAAWETHLEAGALALVVGVGGDAREVSTPRAHLGRVVLVKVCREHGKEDDSEHEADDAERADDDEVLAREGDDGYEGHGQEETDGHAAEVGKVVEARDEAQCDGDEKFEDEPRELAHRPDLDLPVRDEVNEEGHVAAKDGAARADGRLTDEGKVGPEHKAKDARGEKGDEELWRAHHALHVRAARPQRKEVDHCSVVVVVSFRDDTVAIPKEGSPRWTMPAWIQMAVK